MKYTISKEFAFSASHVLAGLPADHQCGRLHGHNYIITVELSAAELDATGFVMDYGDLAFVKAYIDEVLDHRHLNDVIVGNPTAENLASWVHDIVVRPEVPGHIDVAIGVSETPKTWAWYR